MQHSNFPPNKAYGAIVASNRSQVTSLPGTFHSSITLGLITTLKTRYTPSHTMIMQIRHAAKIANLFFRKSDSFNNHSAAIKVDVCRDEERIWNEREKRNITFTRNRIGMNGAEGIKRLRAVVSARHKPYRSTNGPSTR